MVLKAEAQAVSFDAIIHGRQAAQKFRQGNSSLSLESGRNGQVNAIETCSERVQHHPFAGAGKTSKSGSTGSPVSLRNPGRTTIR